MLIGCKKIYSHVTDLRSSKPAKHFYYCGIGPDLMLWTVKEETIEMFSY